MRNVYEQRIGVACQAALDGKTVTFYLDGAHPTYLTWRDERGKRHVISTGTRAAMEAMRVEAQAEFERRLLECAGTSRDLENQDERRPDASRVS